MNNNIKKIIAFILGLCMLFCITGCGDKGNGLTSDTQLSSSSYKLGDYMGDYTVTDTNGNTHTFSEILKDKKAIVLNFWFINCGPCQMEFPYLQKAYEEYSDDIAVVAINPTTDKEIDIKKYGTQNELSIPLVKGDEAWIMAFALQGFPTTVVIDRYGSIAFIHMGAVTQEGIFEKVFDVFTSDTYKQSTYRSISDF
ncbi:MAG: TlpA family protein disulfide reductase [Clostridia bacterium]|nr:TlpA family protein disulfide reductase [Clostridia bacterium]